MQILFGPQLQPLFYFSPITIAGKPHRGGVPILFPQFADRGPLRKHGFARDSQWKTLERNDTDNGFIQVDGLDVEPTDWSGWAHAVSLRWRIEKESHSVRFSLNIHNTGSTSFEWTGGLHPYFRVSSIQAIQVLGLAGEPVSDKFAPAMKFETTTGPVFSGVEFERLYKCNKPLTLIDKKLGLHLKLTQHGFTEWMVWNPGPGLAEQMPDLPPNDWPLFICIEPVVASQPLILKPGEQFTGCLAVELQT